MGCSSQKKLVTLNPTNYVFNANEEQVRTAIGKAKRNGTASFKKYSSHKEYINGYIYNDSINKNDFVSCLLIEQSRIFFRFGLFPYPYDADFILRLNSISENKTEVNIFTLNSTIFIFGIGIYHRGIEWDKKVCPSTIEEYEILLAIGKELGEKGMPVCNYPKRWLKYLARQEKKDDRQAKKDIKRLEL